MPGAKDMELVQEFAPHNSEAAFTGLVRRHLTLVYSVAGVAPAKTATRTT
jgi:hypothetical protein